MLHLDWLWTSVSSRDWLLTALISALGTRLMLPCWLVAMILVLWPVYGAKVAMAMGQGRVANVKEKLKRTTLDWQWCTTILPSKSLEIPHKTSTERAYATTVTIISSHIQSYCIVQKSRWNLKKTRNLHKGIESSVTMLKMQGTEKLNCKTTEKESGIGRALHSVKRPPMIYSLGNETRTLKQNPKTSIKLLPRHPNTSWAGKAPF